LPPPLALASRLCRPDRRSALIDIVHHTHLDVGYTALPSVVRDDQTGYIDAAINSCRADPAFRLDG
jgi:hypothetical protein